jgi:selenocysteine-specific elongation factor
MKRVILGTAGHIDHGKTQLVRALTGVNTDRLKEEQERGISIELGFAALDVGDSARVGIIDVPGHERFVRQMVAGSGGVDLAALVVALDEGVMPQTAEHLDILCLLGIKHGVVVLTKLDLVDEELAMLAEDDVREAVRGTFLEQAPFVKVSSKTGEGVDELKDVLADLVKRVEDKPVHGLLRLPVDRVFSLKGHGTIVAGTLISGVISVGDEIEILPGGKRSSVRSIQSHYRQEEKAFPGERTAVNLRGLEQSELRRGDVLTHPGEFKTSHIMDVRLRVLPRAPFPLRNKHKVRLHHYTTEVEAVVSLPGMDEAPPGTETMAQLRANAPLAPSAGDRFVIRALSPSVTLGGGVVINPRAEKLRARTAGRLTELEGEDQHGIVAALIRSGGMDGCARRDLLGLSGLSARALDKSLETLSNARKAIRFDTTEDRFVHWDFVQLLKTMILERVAAFHQANPLKEGIPKQALRSSLPGSDKLFKKIADLMAVAGELVDEGETVRSPDHRVRLKDEEKGLKEQALKLIVEGDAAPPLLKDMAAKMGADLAGLRNMLGLLEKEGLIVRVREDMFFSAQFIARMKERLVAFIKKEGGVTPSQFQQVTGSSRKYNIPLLEYLDRERFTMRVGDQRVLRGA